MDHIAASASAPLRWGRALVLGAMMMLTGSVAHATAGGLLPTAPTLAALLAVCVLVSAAFLGRSASLPVLVGLLALGQTVIHLALSALAGHVGEPAGPVAWDRVGPNLEALAAETISHAPMMMAHLVAATGVALWLAVGERALWAVLWSLAVIVLRPVLAALCALGARMLPAPVTVLPVLDRTAALPRRLAVLARSVVRRGPPLQLAY